MAGQLKMPAGVLDREAALAAREPPRSFAAFALTPLVPPEGAKPLNIVHFAIACKACGHDAFRLGAHLVSRPPDDQPVHERALRPPHRLKCANCAAVEMLFDPRTDGHDGILGLAGEAPSAGEEAFLAVAMKTYVAATYNIQLSELQEIAAEVGNGVKPSDLFDWINIIQSEPDADSYFLELDYECA